MEARILRILVAMLACILLTTAMAEPLVCDSPDEYLAALLEAKTNSQQGSSTSFQIEVSDELLEALSADTDALLHQLELQAGMVEAHYSSSGRFMRYRNSIFQDDALHADDFAGLIDALEQGARECRTDKRFYVVCSPELYAQATGSLWTELNWICMENCGMKMARCYTGLLPVIHVTGTSYYSGYRIVNALTTDDLDALSSDEQQALQVARAWAAEIRPGSDEDVMRQIHDLICSRVTYDDNRISRDPYNCVGALLDGTCVCSGYADTFFLLGSLCGLEVRIQSGYAPDGIEIPFFRTNHAWNLVRVGGEWRMVDVTWDDADSGICYDYFDLRRSEAPADHTWNWAPGEWNNASY